MHSAEYRVAITMIGTLVPVAQGPHHPAWVNRVARHHARREPPMRRPLSGSPLLCTGWAVNR